MITASKQLIVKRSTLPEAGKGLFTKIFIPKGTKIVEYKGKITSWKDVNHDDGNNLYVFFVNRKHVINAADNKKMLARYANDAKGLNKIKGLKNNSEYVNEDNKIFITATRNIEADEEIFVGYGADYWKAIRANNK